MKIVFGVSRLYFVAVVPPVYMTSRCVIFNSQHEAVTVRLCKDGRKVLFVNIR